VLIAVTNDYSSKEKDKKVAISRSAAAFTRTDFDYEIMHDGDEVVREESNHYP
jgi:hypothetical protein